MDSYAIATSGESLWIEDDEGQMVEVVEVKTSPALARTPQRLDCTHFKCSVMTYKDGIPDLGSELQWTCNLVPRGQPNSNIELLSGLNRTKVRRIIVKLPLAGYNIVMYGQVSYGLAQRSVNAITDLTVSVTPSSDFSLVPLTETYAVTYQPNGGSGSVTDEEDYTPGDEVEVKASTGVTYADHQFVGWNTSQDGTGRLYQPGETFVIFDNTVLYAQWVSTTTLATMSEVTPEDAGQEGTA